MKEVMREYRITSLYFILNQTKKEGLNMDKGKTVYVIIIPKTYCETYNEIPYSYDKDIAYEYCDKLGLIDECVRSIPIEVFEKLKLNSDEAGEYSLPSEISYYDIDGVDYPLSEDDYHNAGSDLDAECVDLGNTLFDLYRDISIIDTDEAREVRKAIKKLIKSLGGNVKKRKDINNITSGISENIDKVKFLDNFLKLKGVSYI